jgi:flagella basal body P-ring formation protein FlgA
MTAARLRDQLARELPGVEIRVVGERACRVWPEVQEILPEVLQETARLELVKAWSGREATFTLVQPVGSAHVPRGERDTSLRVRLPQTALRAGIVGVPIEVLVDGLRYRTVWTSWKVDVWETRQVLGRPVRAGEALRPELFVRSRVPIGGDGGLTTLQPAQVVGAVAKRDMVPGERVTAHDVHRPAAVTLGATLFLRVRKGPIQASVSALALETGAVGDRVRVRTIESGQELQATVVGRDMCEISL